MHSYSLLINGEDVDTGRYDYFPYSEKAITERFKTQQIIRELRQGKFPNNWQDYVYARYCIGMEDTNQKAIEAAHRASLEFKHFPLSARRKIYDDIHALLLLNKEAFIRLLMVEGHPRRLAEWEFEGMEIGSRPDTIDFFRAQLRREIGRSRNEILYWARKPDGVVCLSPPGNASASNSFTAILIFLVGNTLVIKPPLRAPIATIFLWKHVVHEALKKHRAPSGTLNIVVGNSQQITQEWITSPHVDDIVFFGDSKSGLALASRAFERGKKPILELSGNDMLLVWKDADLDQASASMLDGFLGSGQICMVPKIGLIHEQVYHAFVEKIVRQAEALKIGLPSEDPETVLSPVTRMSEYVDFLRDAKDKGAKILCGGFRVNHLGEADSQGIYIRPTVVAINDEEPQALKCMREEIFFPLMPLVKLSGSDEQIFKRMIELANSNEYGLRASAWVRSDSYVRRFAKQLDNCGLLRINSKHAAFSPYIATHGGTGKSGGPFGEMNYMWQKTSHLQGICRTHLPKEIFSVR